MTDDKGYKQYSRSQLCFPVSSLCTCARARIFFFSFFFNSVVLSVVAATVRNTYTNRPRLVITRFIEKRRLLTRSLKRPVFIKSLNFICQSPCFINPPVHSANRQPCVCVCVCVLVDSIVMPGRNIDSLQCPNCSSLPRPLSLALKVFARPGARFWRGIGWSYLRWRKSDAQCFTRVIIGQSYVASENSWCRNAWVLSCRFLSFPPPGLFPTSWHMVRAKTTLMRVLMALRAQVEATCMNMKRVER